ncbi:uncharacterized protein SOCG_04672 [Schizosaccharomyces octosporus yFS286]|uniref:Fungal protein n=1 Tax=Schizosaccharomyces octosporus (strain yFS286) TaxID=483514 RepID=S9R8V8_SCHOY|nr:uncharacterized protein SOCG_04672 [Schizosaccharomyces octosporus yFS286]EPX70534.1 fungal protein [Schizosaccharomyces octosporus yFS286]
MTRKQRKNRKKLEKGFRNIESMLEGSSKHKPAEHEIRNNDHSQTNSGSPDVYERKQKRKSSKKKQKIYGAEPLIQQKLPEAYAKQHTEKSKLKSREDNTKIEEVIHPAPSFQNDSSTNEIRQKDLLSYDENDAQDMIKSKVTVDVQYSQKNAEHLRDTSLDKKNQIIESSPTKDMNNPTLRSDEIGEHYSDSDHSDSEFISPFKSRKSPRKVFLSDSEFEDSNESLSNVPLSKVESDFVARNPKRRKHLPYSSEDEAPERPSDGKYANANENKRDDFDTEVKQEAEDLESLCSDEDEKHKRNRNPNKKAFHEKLELIRKKRQGNTSTNAEENASDSASEKTETSDDDSSNEESFIVDEEEEEEVMGARALLPPEFSMTSHQGLRAHFANFLRYHIKQLMNLQTEINIDDHLLFSCKTIRRRLFSSVESNVISSIWKPSFISILKNRPSMTNRRCEATYGCDACNIHSRLSTQLVRFKGHLYDRDTYKTLENDPEYHEESKKDWLLGSSCYERARLAHKIFHWEYDVNKEITTQLSLAGYFEAPVQFLDQMYHALEENNYPESSWQEYCKLLKFASPSSLSSWPSGYRNRG